MTTIAPGTAATDVPTVDADPYDLHNSLFHSAPWVEAVEEAFGFAETSVVSFEDLFAGKLVAALDRQHPRDLFDVREIGFVRQCLISEPAGSSLLHGRTATRNRARRSNA